MVKPKISHCLNGCMCSVLYSRVSRLDKFQWVFGIERKYSKSIEARSNNEASWICRVLLVSNYISPRLAVILSFKWEEMVVKRGLEKRC